MDGPAAGTVLKKRDLQRLEATGDSPSLIGWLRSDELDSGLKGSVAKALGRIGDPLAVDALLFACSDQMAIEEVLGALARIGDRRAVPGLATFVHHWKQGCEKPGPSGMMNQVFFVTGMTVLEKLLGEGIVDGVRASDEVMMSGWQRYHAKAWTDVDSWDECPLCGGPWQVQVEGAAQCGSCYRYFSNCNRSPIVSDGSDGRPFGELRESTLSPLPTAEAWIDLDNEREAEDHVRLPGVVVHLLMPETDNLTAMQFDNILMDGALKGGPDDPPVLR